MHPTERVQKFKFVDCANENNPDPIPRVKNRTGDISLKKGLEKVNQAYAEQLFQARRFESNTAKLGKELKKLKNECERFRQIAKGLSVEKLNRNSRRLARIMDAHAV